jgi:hypothetical protein
MNQMQEEFYQAMTRLGANSRAASVPRDDARVTEIVNGLIVSNPVAAIRKEPEVIDLQEYAKSSKVGSVSSMGINKVKAFHDFIASNGRRF